MAASGFFTDASVLLLQRLLAGVASAFVFITGPAGGPVWGSPAQRSGLLLGLYYGGTGFGIVVSALGVPMALELRRRGPTAGPGPGGGQSAVPAGHGVAALAGARTGAGEAAAGLAAATPGRGVPEGRLFRARLAFGLLGYMGFGVGYIGYMTFVIACCASRVSRQSCAVACASAAPCSFATLPANARRQESASYQVAKPSPMPAMAKTGPALPQ